MEAGSVADLVTAIMTVRLNGTTALLAPVLSRTSSAVVAVSRPQYRPLYGAKKLAKKKPPDRTVVDKYKHLSYIELALASRRLCSMHRSSDTIVRRPKPWRPMQLDGGPIGKAASRSRFRKPIAQLA